MSVRAPRLLSPAGKNPPMRPQLLQVQSGEGRRAGAEARGARCVHLPWKVSGLQPWRLGQAGGGRLRAGDPLHGTASRGHCALLSAGGRRGRTVLEGPRRSLRGASSKAELPEIRWAARSCGFEVLRPVPQWGACMGSARPRLRLRAQPGGVCSQCLLRRASQVNEKWGGRGGGRSAGGARGRGPGGGEPRSNGEAAGRVKWERVGGLELRVLPCDSRHVWPLPGREGATCPPSPGLIT